MGGSGYVITTVRQAEKTRPVRGRDGDTKTPRPAGNHAPVPAASVARLTHPRAACIPARAPGGCGTTMVEQSDRAPLLDWEEIPPPDPNQVAQPPPQPPREEDAPAANGTAAPVAPAAGRGSTAITCSPTPNLTAVAAIREDQPNRTGSDRPEPLGSDRSVPFSRLTVKDQWEERDQIVAVFVVTFDTRSGEWNRGLSTFTWTVDHQRGGAGDFLSRTLNLKLNPNKIINNFVLNKLLETL